MFTESQKKEIYNKWAHTGYKQPATKEELDIIVELQSKGYRASTYIVEEQDTNNYKVTELQEPKIKPKQPEKDMATLISEAKKYLGNTTPTPTPKQQEQTKREKELEQSAKKWEQYWKDNPSKIPYNWRETFFDIDKY